MMNNTTGRALADELESITQSIADILGTPLGSRLQRRDYGSLWPELIDHPANAANIVRLYSSAAGALMRFEPRIRLSRIQLYAGSRTGQFITVLQGERLTQDGRSVSWSSRIPLQLGATG